MRRILIAVVALSATACASSSRLLDETRAPDLGKRAVGSHGAVTSAHPLASDAGLEILRAGGNAADAAVAAAFAIGVVEPEMSGLGGGGALLYWNQSRRRAEYLDFYPSQPVARWRGVRADTSVPLRVTAIPGNVAGLLEVHARFGRLPRERVMAPAIRLAEAGFPVYQVLAELIERDTARLRADSIARRLYWDGGRLIGVGDTLRNAELAEVLRRVSALGRAGFYEGATARTLVARLNAGGHPATLEDFAAYRPIWKRPLCTAYRGRVALSAPPPMGGLQFLSSLELVETGDLAAMGYPTRSAVAFDLLASAMRVGIQVHAANDDPRWRAIPARGLISDAYAAEWRDVVGTGHAADSLRGRDARAHEGVLAAPCAALSPYPESPAATAPGGHDSALRGETVGGRGVGAGAVSADGAAAAGGETTHISVVDAEGNAVAVTVTNSSMFGAGVAALGFWLNDSGWWPRGADAIPADLPAAWRTRLTTIAPSVFLRDGRVEMVVGSPGGGRIPFALVQTVAYVLDFGLDPLDALRMPRLYPSRGTRVELESGFEPDVLAGVRAMGYRPVPQGFGYARVYLIVRRGGQWVAAADPRHDGQARAY